MSKEFTPIIRWARHNRIFPLKVGDRILPGYRPSIGESRGTVIGIFDNPIAKDDFYRYTKVCMSRYSAEMCSRCIIRKDCNHPMTENS